jgi:hypothetical protein
MKIDWMNIMEKERKNYMDYVLRDQLLIE